MRTHSVRFPRTGATFSARPAVRFVGAMQRDTFMRKFLRSAVLPALLLLPACSGGGSADAAAGNTSGAAVHVVVDTAAGVDGLVQFQVAAAVLEHRDGLTTGNLLAAPVVLTVADASGEASGLALRDAPSGDFTALHLLVAPGTGVVLNAAGQLLPIVCGGDLRVPITDGLLHDRSQSSWLVVGHDAAAPTFAAGTVWVPVLSARLDGSVGDLGLRVAGVQAPALAANVALAGEGVLRVGFDDACTFADDDHGGGSQGRDDFLTGTGSGDDVRVGGRLQRDGSFLATRARRRAGDDRPRLLGRITELRPLETSFVFEVQAELRRNGERRLLDPRVEVLVRAAGARLHRSGGHVVMAFADLLVGDFAKVEFTQRTPVPGDRDEVLAREIEVPGAALMPSPEWQGFVTAVDVGAGTIMVGPWHDDPIVIEGVVVTSVVVSVGAETTIERKAQGGGGRTPIGLGDVLAGGDRIWWRGEVTGPQAVAARWVRVRAE